MEPETGTAEEVGGCCRCHRDRSGFDGPWTQSPITFSNQYFQLLVNEKWCVGATH